MAAEETVRMKAASAYSSGATPETTLYARVVITDVTDQGVSAYGIGFTIKDEKIGADDTLTGTLESLGPDGTQDQDTQHELVRIPFAVRPEHPDPNNFFWPGPSKIFPNTDGKPPRLRMTVTAGARTAVCTVDPAADNPTCE